MSGGEVRLRTRNGLDWTPKFPPVAAALASLKAKDAVLDMMEAVVLDDQGKSGFQALQAALGEGGRRDRIVASMVPRWKLWISGIPIGHILATP